MIGWNLELGSDLPVIAMPANLRPVSPLSSCKTQRAQKNGFARAGLTGQRTQPGLKPGIKSIYEDNVPD